ncbi:hypothetical protein [Streptomyces sp. NEAU-L66]|uniref:hypothetical protein n=1 Tax=Streptomyces sp. NEAU-L66 TaxID=3390812 RepID=UPI0039C75A48
MIEKHARTALSRPSFCGLSRQHLGELTEELAPRRQARGESERVGANAEQGRAMPAAELSPEEQHVLRAAERGVGGFSNAEK